jgi:hypothetical protein
VVLVSFDHDIRPLFRPIDVNHMNPRGVKLSDYSYMSDPTNDHKNAKDVLSALSPQNGDPPRMPPGGPYWSNENLLLFTKWMSDGYQQ